MNLLNKIRQLGTVDIFSEAKQKELFVGRPF